jgi:hypothetical protein
MWKKSPPTQRPRTRRKDLKMLAPPHRIIPDSEPYELVLFDLRDLEVCTSLHKQRAVWQERSDIEALDEDHLVLIIRPDAPFREAA